MSPRAVRFVDRAPRDPVWHALHRAADRRIPAVAAAYEEAVAAMRRALPREADVVLALTAGADLTALVPVDTLTRVFETALLPVMVDTVAAGARAARVPDLLTKAERPPVALRWRQVGPLQWESLPFTSPEELAAGTAPPVFVITRVLRGLRRFWRLEEAGTRGALGHFRTVEGAQVAAARFAQTAGANLAARLRLVNPEAVRIAATRTADLVREIDRATRAAIRQVTMRGARGELTVAEQARVLRQLIGLTERQLASVLNVRQALVRQGVTGKLLARRVREQYRRTLHQRAMTIARTETLRAANMGQQAVWEQARNQGLISTTARRRWLTAIDERTCPICRPMDGQVQAMDEPFRSPHNGAAAHTPPIHPQCRCALVLVQ